MNKSRYNVCQLTDVYGCVKTEYNEIIFTNSEILMSIFSSTDVVISNEWESLFYNHIINSKFRKLHVIGDKLKFYKGKQFSYTEDKIKNLKLELLNDESIVSDNIYIDGDVNKMFDIVKIKNWK